MKKILLLGLFTSFLVYTSRAQSIEPGNDAQGYLNSKNVMVDYCTGIFHYSVPLLEVSSGNFKLPISLNYSSRESMQNMPSGIVTERWNLQTGGIVTRVVRGGIADEEKNKGYIFQPKQDELSKEFIADANNHVKDGESDLFTASFGGNSVNFIIRKEGNSVIAVPMERTNVRIVCEYNASSSSINGWIVTDENGVKYIFRAQEWTKNVNRPTDVITNSLKDKAYISSWYLSLIEIPNANSIQYTYETELDPDGKWASKYLEFGCENSQSVLYRYGVHMSGGLKFDFSGERKYMFEREMKAAESEISFRAFVQSHPNIFPPSEFNTAFSSMHVDCSNLIQTKNTIGAVLGLIASFPGGSFPTAKVIETLNEMMRYYQYTNIFLNLSRAEGYLIDAIGSENLDTSRVEYKSSYKILTPILKKISTGEEDVIFSYNNALNEIVLRDYRGMQKQRIVLDMFHYLFIHELNEIFWYGSDNVLVQQERFSYPDWLLSDITLPSGGKIRVEYEANVCNTEVVKGKRVKKIILEDKQNVHDTIIYHYPYPGYLLYNQISYRDTISYGRDEHVDFSDWVTKSAPICKGIVYLNHGNNGVIYHYVEEEIRGKGFNTYLFSVPASSGNSGERSYSYWLCGLPLGKAVYNIAGQLILLQKNKYCTDLARSRFRFGSEWFEAGTGNFNYSQNQWQVELCEYYMGGDELREYYKKQPKTLLYERFDGTEIYLDPMGDYQDNIIPRSSIVSPRQGYKMYYGGKTVLKNQKQYMFPTPSGQAPSITHLTGSLPSGGVLVSDVEYKYDNSAANANPTRVIRTRENGDQLVAIKRTPLDISSPDAVIKGMLALNQVSPSIKEQVLLLKNGTTDYLLLEESVNQYREVGSAINRTVYLPEKISRYTGNRSLQVSAVIPALESGNLTGNVNEYREETLVYRAGNGEMLPVQYISLSGTNAMCHDVGNNHVIMEAEHCERVYVDAVDKYRVLFNSTGDISNEKIAGNTLLNSLSVKTDAAARHFVVTLLVNPASSKLSLVYSVTDNTEKSFRTSEETVVAGKWQIVQFNINVSSGNLLKVLFPADELAIGVIAPRGVVYAASSYDPAGRLFGKFDQNGLLERYEYDGAGRVVKVYDREGYLLKEYNYKTL